MSTLESGIIREKLYEILSRPEFRPSFIERVNDKLSAFLSYILERLLDSIGPGGFRWFLISLGVIGTTLLFYIIYKVVKSLKSGSIIIDEYKTSLSSVNIHMDKQISMEDISSAAGKGEYREAIRLLYVLCLNKLEESGTIKTDIAYTDRAYASLISEKAPDMAGFFSKFTDFVERKWYGMDLCGEEDFQEGLNFFKAITDDRGGHA